MNKKFGRRPDRDNRPHGKPGDKQGGKPGGGSNQGKWNRDKFFEKKRRLERERRVPGGEESDKPRNAETRWVGGFDAAAAALSKSPYDCREMWIEHELSNPNVGSLISQAKSLNVPVRYMSRPELDRAVSGGKHGGIALRQTFDPSATFSEWITGLDAERKKGLVVVVLDQIQDPHNLGAIARSALQLFARCVVIPERRSAPVTPAVIQASAGAALKIPIHRVVNIAQTLELCKKSGFWVYGADAAGKNAWDTTVNTPCVLVIGSEGYGMRPLVRASCDELMRVPQVEHGVGSLNASCAATALLYEVARQSRKTAP
ncbi:MAG: 23S rRNA (guanosine(2251)-2'-O)-methyltransferase RlmB [Elusimicrobiota bacterium]|nr:MAG: 23S rRNA (guanosine(2251)-2'-O)-methyltransferase RlmB [Elusimicrobiota bacterium]